MFRRVLIGTFAVGALLVPRQSAEAQLSDGFPLATLCSSPTMEFCASFLTWDIIREEHLPLGGYGASLRGTLRLFGSGYERLSDPFVLFVGAGPLLLQRAELTFDPLATIPLADGGPFFTGPDDPNLARSPLDLNKVGLVRFAGGLVDPCGGLADNPCYEVSVPEPSTWLLIATGFLALGFVGWRRREAEAA